jgi:phosphate transport system protein
VNNGNAYFEKSAPQGMLQLRASLLMMASLTQRNFSMAIRSLLERDDRLAELVEAEDSQLDELEISVDDQVVKYVATRAPLATDCRFMLVASKIARNLESIADQAVTIARQAKKLNQLPVFPSPEAEVCRMAVLAGKMSEDSIASLVQEMPEQAQQIVLRDKEVDTCYKTVSAHIVRIMARDARYVEGMMSWLFAAKAVERVADYAKNTAEEVYYLYRAVDIRHGH